jgi:hypothetical protein
MIDFLNRLAARALGVAPVATPMIPTIYSASPGWIEADRGADRAGEARGVLAGPTIPGGGFDRRADSSAWYPEDTIDPSLPMPEPARHPQDTIDPSLPMPEGRPGRRPGRDLTPAPGNSGPEPTPVPVPRPGLADLPGWDDGAAPARGVDDGAARIARLARSPGIGGEDRPIVPGLRPAPGDEPRVMPIGAGAAGRVEAGIAPPAPVRARGEPTPSALPVIGDHGPRITPRARRGPAARPGPEAPSIRVTIGRIEVRAEFVTPAPAPAPARPLRPSSLSLDDYLRQRREGQR